MVKQAEQFAEQDKRRREQADRLNEADSICYQGERMLADFADKLNDEMKQKIEQGIRDTREAVTKADADLAKQRADALAELLKEAGTVIYAQTPGASGPYRHVKTETGQPSGEARPSGSGPRGRVVDADYEETP
jgi:molecular chaperone DnaK